MVRKLGILGDKKLSNLSQEKLMMNLILSGKLNGKYTFGKQLFEDDFNKPDTVIQLESY